MPLAVFVRESVVVLLPIARQSELPVDADVALPFLVPVAAEGALEVAVELAHMPSSCYNEHRKRGHRRRLPSSIDQKDDRVVASLAVIFLCFCLFQGYTLGKSNRKAENIHDNAIKRSVIHAHPLLPVEICRKATVCCGGRTKIPPSSNRKVIG